jgi:hypothetical protein
VRESCRALAASIERARASSVRTPRGWALRYCASRALARSASPLPRRARIACSTSVGSSPSLGGVATLLLGSTKLAAGGVANGSAVAAEAGGSGGAAMATERIGGGSIGTAAEAGAPIARFDARVRWTRIETAAAADTARRTAAVAIKSRKVETALDGLVPPTRAWRRCISNGCGSAGGVARMAAAKKCSAEPGSWTMSTSRFTVHTVLLCSASGAARCPL